MIKLTSTKQIFLITLLSYFIGFSNNLILETLFYAILLFFILKDTKQYWLSKEGFFIIISSLIILIAILGSPELLFNHFKQLILTIGILYSFRNFYPLSLNFLASISIINFILVLLQQKFNFIWLPNFLLSGIPGFTYLEKGISIRPIGLLGGAHQSTFMIALVTLAIIYSRKNLFKSLLSFKVLKSQLFIIFIILINLYSLIFTYSYTALMAFAFQLFVLTVSQINFIDRLTNTFKKTNFKFINLRINIIIFSVTFFIAICYFYFLDEIFNISLYLSNLIFDNRAIQSVEVILAQFINPSSLIENLSLFPTKEARIDTFLGELSKFRYFADSATMGVEIGYVKILHTHGIPVGIYLLSLLFRRLAGLRPFMFFAYLHYGYLTVNPVLLILALSTSNSWRISNKQFLSN
tara:strand:- start:11098 stop:12324 length:1227 start_codon:yes stop_codon:yes gene_type:complete